MLPKPDFRRQVVRYGLNIVIGASIILVSGASTTKSFFTTLRGSMRIISQPEIIIYPTRLRQSGRVILP